MADVSKAHKLKLANSRKRFKELQELKNKKNATKLPEEADNDGQEQTVDSSTHSSINETNVVINNAALPSTQTYFSSSTFGDNSMFFDTISRKQNESEYFSFQPSTSVSNMVSNIVQTPQIELENPFDDNYCLFDRNQHSYIKETQHIIRPGQESTVDEPEETDGFEHRQTTDNLFSDQNKQNLLDYLQGETQQVSDAENMAIKNEIVKNSNFAMEGVQQNSNVSNLKSFSDQMAHFEQSFNDSNSITDLEKRNIELASQLEQERTVSEQQKVTINELEKRISALEAENKIKDNSLLEIAKFKEELQCHAQTIRLLVSEKTELSTSLVQVESNLKEKKSECDELQARLKNSRSRAFELEQELNSLKSEKTHTETNGHEQNAMLENLKRDFENLCEQREEIKQDLLEAREKLRTAIEENVNNKKLNNELVVKLSLAEVKIQQLTSADHQMSGTQVEKLNEEKSELEKEVATLNVMLKNITKERDESTNHYQHYTEDLNSQLVNLQEQFQRLQQENEHLSLQDQNRIRHIGELERQLQSFQNERAPFATVNSDANLKTELDATRELCVQLQVRV